LHTVFHQLFSTDKYKEQHFHVIRLATYQHVITMLLYAHVYYNLHKRKCLKQETNSPNAIVERINKQDESADPQSLKNNSNHISLPRYFCIYEVIISIRNLLYGIKNFKDQSKAELFFTPIFIGGTRQWLKWFCEAGGGEGSPDEARLEQTPYPFQPH